LFYIIYNKDSGQIEKTVDIPAFLKHLVSCDENQEVLESESTINPNLYEVLDGKLTPKPTAE